MFVGVGFSMGEKLLKRLGAYENVTFCHLIIQDSYQNLNDFYIKYVWKRVTLSDQQLERHEVLV